MAALRNTDFTRWYSLGRGDFMIQSVFAMYRYWDPISNQLVSLDL